MCKRLEQLSLVFVQPFDHDIEERVDVHGLVAGRPASNVGQSLLVLLLHVPPGGLEVRIVGVGLQLAQLFEVRQPAVADPASVISWDQAGIGQPHETTRRDAVRLVLEPLGPQFGEVLQA